MAQLVARFHGMEEATGSNPVSSTSRNRSDKGKYSQVRAVLGLCATYVQLRHTWFQRHWRPALGRPPTPSPGPNRVVPGTPPVTGSDPMSRTFSVSGQKGLRKQAHLLHTQCISALRT